MKSKKEIVLKGILYKNKTISDLSKELTLTDGRTRQLLWQGMKDMKNKTIKPFDTV